MPSRIEHLPNPPREIINAVNEGKLAVFIGAGVSRLIGCLGWTELAANLVARCRREFKADGTPVISYKEGESLLRSADHRKTITICHQLLLSSGLKSGFFDELRKALKEGESSIPKTNIYDEIYKMRGIFLTTNADTHFHKFFLTKNIHSSLTALRSENIKNMNLYHIHGVITDPERMAFSLRGYFDRYGARSGDEGFKNFLHSIFEEYTILFLGYGLAEFELLEYLYEQFEKKEKSEIKRFLLMPLYAGEENILGFEQSYYEQMGITVIAYRMDEKGYEQLYEVLKHWSREIFSVSGITSKAFDQIDKTIEDIDAIG